MMRNSFTTTAVILLLSVFHAAAVLATPDNHAVGAGLVLAKRQASTLDDPQCVTYERTANLSAIGGNSTYRSAFLQASPVGTMYNLQMLNKAVLEIPAMTIDRALNQACGNLTTVALTEAERNWTRGVVGQFEGLDKNPQAIVAGSFLVPLVGAIMLSFAAMGFFMP